MSKLLAVSALCAAAALSGLATPASATGNCDEKVEVVCNQTPCGPDFCSFDFCIVYLAPKCVV